MKIIARKAISIAVQVATERLGTPVYPNDRGMNARLEDLWLASRKVVYGSDR